MFAVMWSALVALVLLSSAQVLEVNNQTLCTLPRLFEQYKNSTCTLSYVLEKDPSTVQLYAFDVNCTQVGDCSSVPIGLPYTLHTTLEQELKIQFRSSTSPPKYWYGHKGYEGIEDGYRTTCTLIDGEDAKICEMRFSCEWMGFPNLEPRPVLVCELDPANNHTVCH
ncbi:hypothetical protein EG329_003664 [Mollisiaceae sp. DMI_Dod_QoI]|nr:hypothetical protein EG329_003664 [Helotiales sp. DMI_Dod_QoI]